MFTLISGIVINGQKPTSVYQCIYNLCVYYDTIYNDVKLLGVSDPSMYFSREPQQIWRKRK